MTADLSQFTSEIKELCKDLTSDVDARAIVRRKPFVLEENDTIERIIHLNIEGNIEGFKEGTFTSEVRMDSHVSAIFRLKKSIRSNVIPFIGERVVATHVDISSLSENYRVRIIDTFKDHYVLERSIVIPARSYIRMIDIQQTKKFSNAVCRCCKQMTKVPLFHGVAGYCFECNTKIIKPLKAEIGGYLQALLCKGMCYEEDREARSFLKKDVDSISRIGGKLFITVNNERIHVVSDFNDESSFREVLRTFRYEKIESTEDSYIINGKKCKLKVFSWAKGLATKIKELRVDKNIFLSPKDFEGVFIEKEDFGDHTIRHMRRMFNIAKAKLMMSKRIRSEQDAFECVEKAFMIMNQPDCSRKLHAIISQQLQYATVIIHNNHDLDSEIMQKIVGIMTSIQVGLANTAQAHEEEEAH